MRSVNKVILIGNVTRDPQVRQTENSQSVCTFGLATNRRWTTSNGEQHNMAEFHELVAWSRLAEICEKHIRKGKLLYIEGYLKTRSWETEGVKKFKTEIVVQDLIMLEKKGSGDNEEYVRAEEQPSLEEIESEETPTEEDPENNNEQVEKEKKEESSVEETPTEETSKEEPKEEGTEGGADVNMDLGL